MKLNTINGELYIDKWHISPKIDTGTIFSHLGKENIEIWLENDNWTTYRLLTSQGYIILLLFSGSRLFSIEIYCSQNIVESGKDNVKSLLQRLGGESFYDWGSIKLNFDRKSSYESIFIQYL